jgi:hypothetical protein
MTSVMVKGAPGIPSSAFGILNDIPSAARGGMR